MLSAYALSAISVAGVLMGSLWNLKSLVTAQCVILVTGCLAGAVYGFGQFVQAVEIAMILPGAYAVGVAVRVLAHGALQWLRP
jgi:hypothetical protein